MGLVRTLVAYCDAVDLFDDGGTRDCFSYTGLNPDSTQPYIDLERRGWTTIDKNGEIKTVCPKHGEHVEKTPEVNL